MKDPAYFERVLRGLERAARASPQESDPEAALGHMTRTASEVLGDRDAAQRPGALEPGARDLKVAGIFFVAPARDHLVLLAEHGFPAEQRRLRIGIGDSRPGHTARTGEPVVLADTHGDAMFRQILKTARMGSALYAPLAWRSQVLGVLNIAARASNTYDATDLEAALLFASLAAATWMAMGGPEHLAAVTSELPPWTPRA
jgi:GAF domain-containing protein